METRRKFLGLEWKASPKRIALVGVGVVVVAVAALWLLTWGFERGAAARVFDRLDQIPANEVGVVLGAASSTYYFQYRMDAAAALYKAGKIKRILVSGANHDSSYNEPKEMRASLLRLGVPAAAIIPDYAGFRTLDSIVRAKTVFGLAKFTVVSQREHNCRALFIAAHKGIDAIAFNAEDAPSEYQPRNQLREALARALAVLDVFVLDRQPRRSGAVAPL